MVQNSSTLHACKSSSNTMRHLCLHWKSISLRGDNNNNNDTRKRPKQKTNKNIHQQYTKRRKGSAKSYNNSQCSHMTSMQAAQPSVGRRSRSASRKPAEAEVSIGSHKEAISKYNVQMHQFFPRFVIK